MDFYFVFKIIKFIPKYYYFVTQNKFLFHLFTTQILDVSWWCGS